MLTDELVVIDGQFGFVDVITRPYRIGYFTTFLELIEIELPFLIFFYNIAYYSKYCFAFECYIRN